MTSKQIANPGQAFSLGATWGTPSVDNAMTTETCDLINGTNQILWTGDIVAIDPTGTTAILTTTGHLTNVIGTVGSALTMSAYPAQENVAGAAVTNTFPTIVGSTAGTGISTTTVGGGNVTPFELYPWQTLTLGFTNGNGNITSALVSTNNPLVIGSHVITPYNSSTNATPQIFLVTSNGGSSGAWTAVGSVISGGGTTFSGTTGSFSCAVGRDNVTQNFGWAPPVGWTNTSAFPPGVVVPIILRGFGRVNVDALTTVAASDALGGSNNSVIGTRFAYATTGYANAAGLLIAVALEAYAQRDTSINDIVGVSGHASIRAIIGKM
jgi:hypothetical protein